MDYYFSPSKLTFYPESLRRRYELNGTWPGDAFLVSAEVRDRFSQRPPCGMQLAASVNGPTWTAATPMVLSRDETLARRLDAYRTESDPLKAEAEYNALVEGIEPDYTAWLAKVAEIKGRYPLSN